jgi:AmpD protein
MKIQTGWLDGVVRCLSPHCDDRPDIKDINLLVIHNISLPEGVFGGRHVNDLFLGQIDCSHHSSFGALRGLRVSAHVLIRRGGEVVQFVPFHRRAWHAGDSVHEGRFSCNDFSIGIELEGTDTWAYTAEQYEQLRLVTRCLLHYYPAILSDRIVGHSDIAPGRKSDPGEAFDWGYYRRGLFKEGSIQI